MKENKKNFMLNEEDLDVIVGGTEQECKEMWTFSEALARAIG